MSDVQVKYLLCIIVTVLFALLAAMEGKNNHDKEMAAAGLQECVVHVTNNGSVLTVWQKECH